MSEVPTNMFRHPLFTCDSEGAKEREREHRPQYHGDIFSLLTDFERDPPRGGDGDTQDTVSFFFFDFDDTLHLTAPATHKLYHSSLSPSALEALSSTLATDGLYFNPSDPPPHPHLGRLLHHLKSRYHNVLLLSAGSAAQLLPCLPLSSPHFPFYVRPCSLHGHAAGDAAAIELTLLSNYASLWRSAYGDDMFAYFGTDERLLPRSQANYWSPASLSLRGQLCPTDRQRGAMDFLFTHISAALSASHTPLASSSLSSSSPSLSSPSSCSLSSSSPSSPSPSPPSVHPHPPPAQCTCEPYTAACALIPKTAYVHTRGLIPVHTTKADALLRYLYHVFTAYDASESLNPSLSSLPSSSSSSLSFSSFPRSSLAGKRVIVYFVDDQDRYLRDVEGYKSSLFLAAAKAVCPHFCAFVNESVTVQTYLMPEFRPIAPPPKCN